MAYFAEDPMAEGINESFGARIGAMEEAPATAGQPDTLQRIVGRGMALVAQSERFGQPLTQLQKRRILCWLPKLLVPTFDDRYLMAQSILDFRNMTWRPQPSYSNARQWLLPKYAIDRRIIATDATIVRTLKQIDENLELGRIKINQEYGQHQGTVHIRVQQLAKWIREREADPQSIYFCHRGY